MSYPHQPKSAWKLGPKFSLCLVLIFLLSSIVTLGMLSQHLNHQAEQVVKERAEILLTAAQAARNYTQTTIQPLLESYSESADAFIEASVPNFAARKIFADFRQQDPEFQDFSYKEATPNPTNPEDRSDAFETQIFKQLQLDPKVLSGYRTVEQKQQFYIARPIVMRDAQCLACHSQPSRAPKQLLKMYPDAGGFGWQLNDVVAAQMVYVPVDRILAQGRNNLLAAAQILSSIFAALFVMINLLLWRMVIRPLKTLTDIATKISRGVALQSPPDRNLLRLTMRQDEPGQLARASQYMLYVLGRREQDLQQAVQERTASLEQEMRDRQTAQDAVQTYAHAINHDLRNLTMGISSLVQGVLFARSFDTSTADSAQPISVEPTALNLIQTSCVRQLNLMDSLFEVKSADVWAIELMREPVNLHQLTVELQATYQGKLLGTAATITNQIAADLPIVQADVSQLQRVFDNLVDNALKYNANEVEIRFSATVDDAMVRCCVIDNGMGIPAEKRQTIFEMYVRGATEQTVSGHGLGLYICRKIIEAHGGAMGVTDGVAGGAEFWFTLPL
ncbi:DUF3365 domain-containing protein [filamentous cyanobacterium LEGE 11480]|uniref:histidine kinase n=1 Tax=Romeriopsis navalis LEGE 11480 TaxID=2777977 RepID=A0A928Z3V9_9CYAN|nr:DUF3365 domain-containing protein [Romeriopsis navalis]MBE9031906.1 DUF3365 domain-containing protein [Romeriopsis navalis LEGE 11480]